MGTGRHAVHCSTAALLAALLLPLPVGAAGLPDGWPRTAGLAAYDETLARHVRMGGADYDGLARDDRGLDFYLCEVASVDSTALDRRPWQEKTAFWINSYNALTLDLIVRNLRGPDGKGPRLRSIRDIPDAWTRPRRVVAGRRRSLDEIEQLALKTRFQDPAAPSDRHRRDPMVHFALVCAARSCPALRPRAYAPDSLEAELRESARAFLADTTRNRLRVRRGVARLSELFRWYVDDFVGATGHIDPDSFGPYYDEKTATLLLYLGGTQLIPEAIWRPLQNHGIRIEYIPYDWSLNDAPPGR